MHTIRAILAGLVVLTAATANPLEAQLRSVGLKAFGGGYSALENLTETGPQTDLGSGFVYGVGLEISPHPLLALGAELGQTKSDLESNGVESGTEVRKVFLGGDLRLQYPTRMGLMPYVFGGVGAVNLSPDGIDDADETTLAWRFGGGMSVRNLLGGPSLFAEVSAWSYDVDDLDGPLAGFDKRQLDLVYKLGLAYYWRI